MRNLHRMTGAVYEHEKPGLCQQCAFRQAYTDKQGVEWEGFCTAKNKILCCPTKAKKPRCEDYKPKPEADCSVFDDVDVKTWKTPAITDADKK